MRKLIYGMGVSLDGFIAGPTGEFDWSAPDEELHRFHNEGARAIDLHLYGRRMWETMRVWAEPERFPSPSDAVLEFAEIWQNAAHVVFSRTLDEVEGDARLHRGDAVEEVARLKAEPGGDIGVGGAGLAASLMPHGLIDEYRLFVNPVVVGGGTPFFPQLEERLDLELAEERTFSSRVVYLCYRAASLR